MSSHECPRHSSVQHVRVATPSTVFIIFKPDFTIMALLSSRTLDKLKIFTKAPKSLCKFPGRQESKSQLTLLNAKRNGGRKETLDDSEARVDSATGRPPAACTWGHAIYLQMQALALWAPWGYWPLVTLGDEWRDGWAVTVCWLPAQTQGILWACSLTPILTLDL